MQCCKHRKCSNQDNKQQQNHVWISWIKVKDLGGGGHKEQHKLATNTNIQATENGKWWATGHTTHIQNNLAQRYFSLISCDLDSGSRSPKLIPNSQRVKVDHTKLLHKVSKFLFHKCHRKTNSNIYSSKNSRKHHFQFYVFGPYCNTEMGSMAITWSVTHGHILKGHFEVPTQVDFIWPCMPVSQKLACKCKARRKLSMTRKVLKISTKPKHVSTAPPPPPNKCQNHERLSFIIKQTLMIIHTSQEQLQPNTKISQMSQQSSLVRTVILIQQETVLLCNHILA